MGRRDRPYLAIGWFWFLGTLVPVIGLVQVGGQAIADRYTYIPLIGVFIAVAWGAKDANVRAPRGLMVASAAAALLFLAASTWTQIGVWHDSLTLWRHALQVTGPNSKVFQQLGGALVEAGREAEAVPYLETAAGSGAKDSSLFTNLGVALFRLGRYGESEANFAAALRLDARDGTIIYNLGCVRLVQGRSSEAIADFEKALALNPFQWQACLALAEMTALRGAAAEAQAHFERALQIDRQAALAVWRKSHPAAADAAALAEQTTAHHRDSTH